MLDHSASIIKHLGKYKNSEIVYILPDDEISSKRIGEGQNPKISYFSYRWIDYCLGKKTTIKDPKSFHLFHVFPLPCKVPLKGFENFIMYAAGYKPHEKKEIHEIILILGA